MNKDEFLFLSRITFESLDVNGHPVRDSSLTASDFCLPKKVYANEQFVLLIRNAVYTSMSLEQRCQIARSIESLIIVLPHFSANQRSFLMDR